jgi:hypothetical protein
VLFKHLVQLVDTRARWLSAYIKQDTDVRIDERAKGIEEPVPSVSIPPASRCR